MKKFNNSQLLEIVKQISYRFFSEKSKEIDMFIKLLSVVAIVTSFSAFANDVRLELDSTSRIDSWTSRGNMLLEGVASDSKSYKIRLSCISAERNHAQGFAIGEMHVYKGSSHIGSKATFEYSDCLDLYDGLKTSEIKIVLDWDKTAYEASPTGELVFAIENL
jgi:hypothetical protein